MDCKISNFTLLTQTAGCLRPSQSVVILFDTSRLSDLISVIQAIIGADNGLLPLKKIHWKISSKCRSFGSGLN